MARKFKHDNPQLPILFEDIKVQIYKNQSGDIFIEEKESGVVIRLLQNPTREKGLLFTTGSLVQPTQTDGMIGWKITNR